MESRWKKATEMLMLVLLVAVAGVYILYITNEIWGYIPLGSFLLEFLAYFIYYGPLVLAMSITLYIADGKHVALRVTLAIFWIVLIIFAVSPTLWGLIA